MCRTSDEICNKQNWTKIKAIRKQQMQKIGLSFLASICKNLQAQKQQNENCFLHLRSENRVCVFGASRNANIATFALATRRKSLSQNAKPQLYDKLLRDTFLSARISVYRKAALIANFIFARRTTKTTFDCKFSLFPFSS